jgi:hypothetical protein
MLKLKLQTYTHPPSTSYIYIDPSKVKAISGPKNYVDDSSSASLTGVGGKHGVLEIKLMSEEEYTEKNTVVQKSHNQYPDTATLNHTYGPDVSFSRLLGIIEESKRRY